MHTKFWSENLKERDHLEDLGVDGKVILEWICGKQGENMWAGLMWLRMAVVNTAMNHRFA